MRRVLMILLAVGSAGIATAQQAPTTPDPALAAREAALRAEAWKMPEAVSRLGEIALDLLQHA